MKAKSLHFTKHNYVNQIASELGRVYECVCDKIPPAYPCESEKIVFVGVEANGHLDRQVDSFLRELTPIRAANVALYAVNGKGDASCFDKIATTLEANGVHVAGKPLGIALKGGLIKKLSPENIEQAMAWAKELVANDLK